ncbi:ASCH domain-containing protein [Bradyrhizobium yuanmingense]|uniref:ASCH domain-containing protein n=1 Tax=Bradyrhizobium yuanmingense TaxID=108015 RepID=UPI0009E6B94D
MKTLPLSERLIPWVIEGRKTSTVRLGKRNYELGDSVLISREHRIPIRILSVTYSLVRGLDGSVAKTEGYNSLDELKEELRYFYPDIDDDSEVTVVRFTPR